MKFREDASIDINSATGHVSASLEIRHYGFWSGLLGGSPFRDDYISRLESILLLNPIEVRRKLAFQQSKYGWNKRHQVVQSVHH